MSNTLRENISHLRYNQEIAQRNQQERLQQFQEATKHYLSQLNNEIRTLEEQKPHFQQRNELFKKELSDLLRKYENSALLVFLAQKKTLEERLSITQKLQKLPQCLDPENQKAFDEDISQLKLKLEELQSEMSKPKPSITYDLQRNRYQGNHMVSEFRSKREQFEQHLIMNRQRVLESTQAIRGKLDTHFQQELDQYQSMNVQPSQRQTQNNTHRQNTDRKINSQKSDQEIQKNDQLQFLNKNKTEDGFLTLNFQNDQIKDGISSQDSQRQRPQTNFLSQYSKQK